MPKKTAKPQPDPLALAVVELAKAINRLAASQERARPQLGGGGGERGYVFPHSPGNGGGGAGSSSIVRTITSGGGGAGAAAAIPA